MSFDPWTSVKTKNDFSADEIISALQKEIRRGNTENAALIAYEMFTTSRELEEKLWERLLVISVEDIGWGELNAPVLIKNLYDMHNIVQDSLNRGLFVIHAVRYLCGCVKDRSTDEMYAWIRHEVAEQGLQPSIPNYAFDMHTAKGQEMGRGRRFFLEEAAKVQPELVNRERKYLIRLLDKLS